MQEPTTPPPGLLKHVTGRVALDRDVTDNDDVSVFRVHNHVLDSNWVLHNSDCFIDRLIEPGAEAVVQDKHLIRISVKVLCMRNC